MINQSLNPRVISDIVLNDLCIGCGMCISECPTKAISMDFNSSGFIEPKLTGVCEGDSSCLNVCPFNIMPIDDLVNENKISDHFIDNFSNQNPMLGKVISTYAGHSNLNRENASSGGIITWVLQTLIEKKIVDYIIAVSDNPNGDENLFGYVITNNIKEINNLAKTKYYPITMEKIIMQIESTNFTYAITAIPCFVKAIRLKQYYNNDLKNRIKFIVGIFCGGMKSSFFTEYLSDKINVKGSQIKNPKYRIKNTDSSASDYSFGFDSDDCNKTIRMKDVGDMWGTGLFKHNACDFCDDLTSELADISLGDAWISPYLEDGRGANIIITRTKLADELVQFGIDNDELNLKDISEEEVYLSQKGGFNHRRYGLRYRLLINKLLSKVIPVKRENPSLINPFFMLVQILRSKIRKNSIKYWLKYGNSQNFDKKMKFGLFQLKLATKIYHISRKYNFTSINK